MPSVRTLTPHFNTPPQRKILIIPTPQPCHKSKLEQRRTRRVRKSAWLWRTEPNSTHRSRIYTINMGFQKSTLCDRARGMQSRQKAHEDYQALPPAMEDALKKWALRMDSQGFPPRLDIFKALAKTLFQQQLDDSNDSEPKSLGPTWREAF